MGNFPISVCLIVKNEGKYLSKALDAVSEIASEIIVINSPPANYTLNLSDNTTDQLREKKDSQPNPLLFDSSLGSLSEVETTNGTKEKNTTSSSPLPNWPGPGQSSNERGFRGELKLFDFPWNDDLSAVRNFAIEKATQPWILFFGPDCIFDLQDKDELDNCISKPDIDLFYLKFIDSKATVEELNSEILTSTNQVHFEHVKKENEVQISFPRLTEVSDINLRGLLFRNRKDIRFKGRVFERIIGIETLKSETTNIHQYQFHYSEEIKAENVVTEKKLLLLALNEEQDINDKLFYQSKILTFNLNSDPSIKQQIFAFNNILKVNQVEPARFEQWYFDSTTYLLDNNELKLCLDILLEILDKYPLSLALLFNFNRLLFNMGKIYECTRVLNYMIFLVNNKNILNPEITFPAKLLSQTFLNNQMALCYDELSNYPSSLYYFKDINNFFKYEIQKPSVINEKIINDLEAKIAEGNNFTLVRLKLSREYIRAQQYKKAFSAYIETLTKASREEDLVYIKLVYSDLVFNGKALCLDENNIAKIIENAGELSKNFSKFWYSLGKYYLSTGDLLKAEAYLQKAQQIEEKLEKNMVNLHLKAGVTEPFIDILVTSTNDNLIKAKTSESKAYASPAISYLKNDENFLNAKELWEAKDIEKAIEYFLLIETESDYDKFVVNDYLALGYEILNDYFNSLKFIKKTQEFYSDEFILEREEFSCYKKYSQIIKSASADFPENNLRSSWAEIMQYIENLPKKPENILITYHDPAILSSLADLLPECKIIEKNEEPYINSVHLSGKSNIFFFKNELDIEKLLTENPGKKKIDILFTNNFAVDTAKYSQILSENRVIFLQGIENKNEELWEELITLNHTLEFLSPKSPAYNFGVIIRPPEKKIYERYNFVSQSIMRHMYDDNIDTLKYCFEDLGIEYNSSENELRKGYNNILFLPISIPPFSNYAADFTYIVYQMEQIAIKGYNQFLNGVRYTSYLRLMKNAVDNWDYAEKNIQHLNSLNIKNISFLSFGYHPRLEVLDGEKEKTLDVFFSGALSPRRIHILDTLEEKGYKVKYLFNIYGKRRNSYIEKAKIVLNMGSHSGSILEEQRMSFLLNNRCFIISEKPAPGEIMPYSEGIVYVEYDKMIETCEFYLKPENEYLRKQIAEKGYQEFSNNKMVDNLKRILLPPT
jgi:hypothetical protein